MKQHSSVINITEVLKSILLFYAVVLVSFTTIFSHEVIFRYIAFVLLSIFYILIYGIKFDKVFYYITLVWIIINFLSSYFNKTSFNIKAIVVYLLVIWSCYFILKIIGEKFWEKFEKLIFALVIISTIIYGFNLLIPEFFFSLEDIFQPITAKVFKERYTYYWTSLIYTHSYLSNAPVDIVPFRNSGFMWEPGAYAMILVIMILYNWYTKGINFSRRVLFYFFVLVITFSTAGYISLIILALIYFLRNNKNVLIWIAFVCIFLVGYQLFGEMDFLWPKIERYLSESETGIAGYKVTQGIYEVNRYAAFIIKAMQWYNYPLGYGIVADEKVKGIIDGVNGIGDLLFRWGIIGIVFLIISLYKFFLYIKTKPEQGGILILLSILAIFIMFFSNPIELHPILFFIVFTPYIYKKYSEKKEQVKLA